MNKDRRIEELMTLEDASRFQGLCYANGDYAYRTGRLSLKKQRELYELCAKYKKPVIGFLDWVEQMKVMGHKFDDN